MDKPFAITLDVGSSRPTRPARGERSAPATCTACRRATTAAPPARTSSSWLYHAESGDYETAWRELVRDNPLPAVMGRVCYHPCETACNRGAAGRDRRHPRRRALPRRRGDPPRMAPDGRRPSRPASGSWSSGPARPGSRPPTISPACGHAGRHPRGRADGRRHDALRHPPLPPAARRARRGGPADP